MAFAFVFLLIPLIGMAQELPGVVMPGPETMLTPDTAKVRQSSAWTLVFPLGQHKESTIDTTLYNYQRIAIPAMYSDAMARGRHEPGRDEGLRRGTQHSLPQLRQA